MHDATDRKSFLNTVQTTCTTLCLCLQFCKYIYAIPNSFSPSINATGTINITNAYGGNDLYWFPPITAGNKAQQNLVLFFDVKCVDSFKLSIGSRPRGRRSFLWRDATSIQGYEIFVNGSTIILSHSVGAIWAFSNDRAVAKQPAKICDPSSYISMWVSYDSSQTLLVVGNGLTSLVSVTAAAQWDISYKYAITQMSFTSLQSPVYVKNIRWTGDGGNTWVPFANDVAVTFQEPECFSSTFTSQGSVRIHEPLHGNYPFWPSNWFSASGIILMKFEVKCFDVLKIALLSNSVPKPDVLWRDNTSSIDVYEIEFNGNTTILAHSLGASLSPVPVDRVITSTNTSICSGGVYVPLWLYYHFPSGVLQVGKGTMAFANVLASGFWPSFIYKISYFSFTSGESSIHVRNVRWISDHRLLCNSMDQTCYHRDDLPDRTCSLTATVNRTFYYDLPALDGSHLQGIFSQMVMNSKYPCNSSLLGYWTFNGSFDDSSGGIAESITPVNPGVSFDALPSSTDYYLHLVAPGFIVIPSVDIAASSFTIDYSVRINNCSTLSGCVLFSSWLGISVASWTLRDFLTPVDNDSLVVQYSFIASDYTRLDVTADRFVPFGRWIRITKTWDIVTQRLLIFYDARVVVNITFPDNFISLNPPRSDGYYFGTNVQAIVETTDLNLRALRIYSGVVMP